MPSSYLLWLEWRSYACCLRKRRSCEPPVDRAIQRVVYKHFFSSFRLLGLAFGCNLVVLHVHKERRRLGLDVFKNEEMTVDNKTKGEDNKTFFFFSPDLSFVLFFFSDSSPSPPPCSSSPRSPLNEHSGEAKRNKRRTIGRIKEVRGFVL